MIDSVELVIPYQPRQVSELQRDDAVRLEDRLQSLCEVIEFGHVGQHVVHHYEIGSDALDDEIFRGSGAGEIEGILASDAASGATISQAIVGGQAPNGVIAENFSQMHARLHPRHRAKAEWYVNQELGPQLDVLSVSIGTGGGVPAWIRYGEDGVMRIKGLPVRFIEPSQAAASSV